MFQRIYWVFLILGTLVGVVVISYMLHKAYTYRDRPGREDDYDRPELGELPQGSGGGGKLLLSFSLSAIIVISLVLWSYGTLLYVEQGDQQNPIGADGETIEVMVEGYQFGWDFVYQQVPGHESGLEVRNENELRVPRDVHVKLNVTSRDVFHNFGVPSLRVKADAMPGQYTTSWFIGDTTGTYQANCYELCGAGHSYMQADIVVMEPDRFEQWYETNQNETEA